MLPIWNCSTVWVAGEEDVPLPGVVAAVTVTAQVAVKLPSEVVAVMFAVPAATPVTNPLELTVAAPVLLEPQVTAWLVALVGATVAVS